jgi:Carboxypeptidase regulatory-like domain
VSTTRIEVRRQVAIAGRVTVAPSGAPASGALVAITSAPAPFEERLGWRAALHGGSLEGVADRPDQVRAAADGHFHFLDLPPGAFGLTASIAGGGSRYGTVSVDATVVVSAAGDVTVAHADLVIPATTLTGLVVETANGTTVPVHMASIRVTGSGESTFTAADGTFVLAGVEAGPHSVTVSAVGRQQASVAVTLTRGAATHVDVSLEPE